MKNIVNIKNLNYKPFDNFNLTIKENSFIAISGPNNSGKTTLMRILNGEKDKDLPIEILGKDLKNYNLGQYGETVQALFPLEIIFNRQTLEEELEYYNINTKEDKTNFILKSLNTKKLLKTKFSEMEIKDIIRSQLTILLLKPSKILIIDELSNYYNSKEINDILKILKEYQKENEITIIYTTINLEEVIDFDYLYIINNGKLIIEGLPLSVLEKDSLLNKIGLKIPFMIDLSVKLKDYELLEDIELKPEGIVDKLWK